MKMRVIYDKVTRRVVVAEIEGIYTLPLNWEIKEFDADASVFVEKGGNVYLKADADGPVH